MTRFDYTHTVDMWCGNVWVTGESPCHTTIYADNKTQADEDLKKSISGWERLGRIVSVFCHPDKDIQKVV